MPTRTFLKLDQEKQLRILRAAKKEFSRVPFNKAIIANIVRDADIPRGSFYQYFENMEDLFTHLLDYMYGINKRKFQRLLKKTENDIYEALKLKFQNTLDVLANEENRQFRINIMGAIFEESRMQTDFIQDIVQPDIEVDITFFPDYIKESKHSKNIIEMIIMVGKNCLNRFLRRSDQKEEIIEEYNAYIDLLKLGFNKI